MQQDTFTAGQVVYSAAGETGRYVAPAGSAHIVSPIFESGDEEYSEGVAEWRRCFSEAPVAKLAEAAAAIEARRADAQAVLSKIQDDVLALRKEKVEFERDQKARMDRLKQHAGLAQLEQFLSGELTHYVIVTDYSVTVKAIADTVEDEDSSYYKKSLKLLTLYGKSDGDLAWRLHNYSTGGSYSQAYECYPCVGIEAATELAKRLMTEKISGWASERNTHLLDRFIAPAQVLDVDVPQGLLDKIVAYKWDNQTSRVDAARKKLDEAEADLRALTVPAAPSVGEP